MEKKSIFTRDHYPSIFFPNNITILRVLDTWTLNNPDIDLQYIHCQMYVTCHVVWFQATDITFSRYAVLLKLKKPGVPTYPTLRIKKVELHDQLLIEQIMLCYVFLKVI